MKPFSATLFVPRWLLMLSAYLLASCGGSYHPPTTLATLPADIAQQTPTYMHPKT